MNSREFAQVKHLVEAVSGELVVKRVHVVGTNGAGTAITGSATTGKDLLFCDVDNNPDEDLATDDSNTAECQVNTRIVALDLMFWAKTTASTLVEAMIYKDPDAVLGATVDPSTLFTQDVSSSTTILRKTCLTWWPILASTTRDLFASRIQISRAALARNRHLKANDKIRLSIKNGNAASGLYWMTGKIVIREG